ncbi:MAG: hypothetical protein V1906_02060 [Candidatus Woesearchaeota archaeon]
MVEYYGKISVNSICTNNKYFSGLHGDADVKSNVIEISRELAPKLPDLLDKANFYMYDMQRGK